MSSISSIAAIGTALPGNAFYAATKAEVAILTKRFAMELGPHNITVNAVAPGFVRTDIPQSGRGAGDWQGTEERFAAKAMTASVSWCRYLTLPCLASPVREQWGDIDLHRLPLLVLFWRQHGEGLTSSQSVDGGGVH